MARHPLEPVRSTDEARKRGRNGGIASGEARRKKKTLRQALEMLLELPNTAKPDQTNLEAVVAALMQEALGGNVHAFAALRDTIGQKPTDKLEHSGAMDLAAHISEGRKRVAAKR